MIIKIRLSDTNLLKYVFEINLLSFCKSPEDQEYVSVPVESTRLNVQ